MKRLTDRQIERWQKAAINALKNLENIQNRVREHRQFAVGSKYTFVNDTNKDLQAITADLNRVIVRMNRRFDQTSKQERLTL